MFTRSALIVLWLLGSFSLPALGDGDETQLGCGCESFSKEQCDGTDLTSKKDKGDLEDKIAAARRRTCKWIDDKKCVYADQMMAAKSCGGQKATPPCEQKVADKQRDTAAPEKAPAAGALATPDKPPVVTQ